LLKRWFGLCALVWMFTLAGCGGGGDGSFVGLPGMTSGGTPTTGGSGTTWQPPAGATPATGNYVYLQSDTGDYIGAGSTHLYTQATAAITTTTGTGLFNLRVEGDESWSGDFKAKDALTRLEPGTYSDLTRYPFHDPAIGGLDWSGEGRGCNTLTGWFVIDSVTYTGTVITAIELRFEQHCEGAAPALRGKLRWSSADTTAPAGPVNPAPSGLWQPTAGATPASGNYVYLESTSGDYIGQGQTYTYTPTTAALSVSGMAGLVQVNVNGDQSWSGEFQAMNSVSSLQVGYYGDLQRYPFHNPVKGGLSWGGEGRGCNELTGWFVVDSVTYTGTAITAIELRFEQHCEGAAPALRGKLRWAASS
jgi:hypothetical protein